MRVRRQLVPTCRGRSVLRGGRRCHGEAGDYPADREPSAHAIDVNTLYALEGKALAPTSACSTTSTSSSMRSTGSHVDVWLARPTLAPRASLAAAPPVAKP